MSKQIVLHKYETEIGGVKITTNISTMFIKENQKEIKMKTYSRYFQCGFEIIACDDIEIAFKNEDEINNPEFDIALAKAVDEVASKRASGDEYISALAS
jgi:hypothetical protein